MSDETRSMTGCGGCLTLIILFCLGLLAMGFIDWIHHWFSMRGN